MDFLNSYPLCMLTNKSTYIIFAIVIALLFSVGAYFKFSTQHEKLPTGCDEFGYMNMAKAFSNNNAFNDHAPRPFLKNLINTFKQNGVNEAEYVWMVVPHAYHFSSKTKGKIINQYAPGTSYILSWIPIEFRKKSFPFLIMFLTFIIPFVVVSVIKKLNSLQTILALTVLMLLLSLSTPFITEIARVNSLAFTFGLFIVAGLTARTHPLIALFFIVLSANFRVINLLMLLPLLLFFIPLLVEMIKTKKWKSLFIFSLKSITIATIGILPYLFYVGNLLGNPLLPTYPSHDTDFNGIHDLLSNVQFYFSYKESWFLAHVATIVILLFQVKLKQLTYKEFLLWLMFPVINYLFFSFHKVQMSYYPFASVFILFGAIIFYFSKNKVELLYKKYIIILPLLFSVVMCADGIVRYSKKEHLTFEEDVKNYLPLCDYTVVWGEMLSGTAEYACNNNGFKYNFGTSKAREIALKFLRDNHYSQVIICNDIPIDFEKLKDELNLFKIGFEIQEMPTLGKLIVIKAKNGI